MKQPVLPLLIFPIFLLARPIWGEQLSLRIDLSGYQGYELLVTRTSQGWLWEGFRFNERPGLVVDLSSGALYRLTPEQVRAFLASSNGAFAAEADSVYIAFVTRPDPAWERIGHLIPLAI